MGNIIRWLHLSDIHLTVETGKAYRAKKIHKGLFDTLKEYHAENEGPGMIFITGDLFNKGGESDDKDAVLLAAKEFLDELLKSSGLAEKYNDDAKKHLFIVPGNHDVNRELTTQLKRTLKSPEDANDFFSETVGQREPYFKRFSLYQEFFNDYFKGIREVSAEAHYYAEMVSINSANLGIVGLNSAWFCQDEEDEHKLWLGERVCDEAFDSLDTAGGTDLTFVLYHHPLAWLHNKEKAKGILSSKASVCLYGHIHCDDTKDIVDQHGKALYFQAGAAYENSEHPCRALYATMDLDAGEVTIKPITYAEGPPPKWVLDTSFFTNEKNSEKAFPLPQEFRQSTIGSQPCDPFIFYTGGSATKADIAADLDVPRTRYISAWTDKDGIRKKAWKERLFNQPQETLKKGEVRLVFVYGHRGSGKTTLCKRMVHDLKANSIPVIDYMPFTLSLENVTTIEKLINKESGKCIHVFTKIEDIKQRDVVEKFLESIQRLKSLKRGLVIYIAVDTNKWKQIEDKIGIYVGSMGCKKEPRHLLGQLDERELDDLVSRLKTQDCLFRLKHKEPEGIKYLFRSKAKKGLLTSLIEVTRGTKEGQDLKDILWHEYQSLSDKGKWAYALVVFFHAFGITVPFSVMQPSLNELTGDPSYFESTGFNNETNEIVYQPATASYGTRNRLVAETLLQQFEKKELDGHNYRLIRAVFNSLELNNPQHYNFFSSLLERKVLKIIRDLNPLVQDVNNGEFFSIQNSDTSRVINSIVRVYQGRGSYWEAKVLANNSLESWSDINNPANYLKAYCDYNLKEFTETRNIANSLVSQTRPPNHILHGIALLCMLRDWEAAATALKTFEALVEGRKWSYHKYYTIKQKVEAGLSVTYSDVDIDSLRPTLALEKIQLINMLGETDDVTVYEQYKKLIARQHDYYQAYISYFKFLHHPKDDDDEAILRRYREMQDMCEYHIKQHEGFHKNYPDKIISLVYSNSARALFKIDYMLEEDYPHKDICKERFEKAISFDRENWYAHNWYGTLLKEAMQNSDLAKISYVKAINGSRNNPVFKHNLALLYYNSNLYSKNDLEVALQLTVEAESLCKEIEYWENFRHYPEDLHEKIKFLLNETSLKAGDTLEADKMLLPDLV